MSKFSNTKETPKVFNLAGGKAYSLTAKQELVGIAMTSLGEATYYEATGDRYVRLGSLLPRVGPQFAMNAARFARSKGYMRTISHVLAGEIAHQFKGVPGLVHFFDRIIERPDDMAEILGYYTKNYGKVRNTRKNGKPSYHLPTALLRGFKKAFNRFDDYQIAKYQMKDKEWSMVDIVNLIRPVPTDRNKESLNLLINDALKKSNTWEDKMASGQSVTDTFGTLLREKRMPYMALLMNLRNIVEKGDRATLDLALERLQDPVAISRAKVLPFQFWAAYKALAGYPEVIRAISRAFETSCQNVPDLQDALVAIDTSASMESCKSAKSTMQFVEIAAIMGAALAKRSASDLMIFADTATYVPYNPDTPALEIADKVTRMIGRVGHSTSYSSVIQTAKRDYSRMIYVTDTQGWLSPGYYGDNAQKAHKARGLTGRTYEVDLCGYGTSKFPTSQKDKHVLVSGLGTKVFDFIEMAERGVDGIVEEIENYE